MKTIYDFKKSKNENKKISMLTCYDYGLASLLNNTEVDCLLVGDSVAMVQHGFESTVHADLRMMTTHTSAVRRGATKKFIVSDMPFLAHRKGKREMMNSVDSLMKAGANAVKIEVNVDTVDLSYIVQSGVPVVSHLGLTPQSINQLGGYKVQGKTNSSRDELLITAKKSEDQGAFMLVLECVPKEVATLISASVDIPVIGIGAGIDVDGQVLVINDMLGLNPTFSPRFVRTFLSGAELIEKAVNDYVRSVSARAFPSEKESFLC